MPLEKLAPDQRAAVELVLRQGRSYGELADLLGMPEDTIRARARGGLTALAGDQPAPPRAGEIADWLLGQQAEAHAVRTRALLESDPDARAWAAAIAAPLRSVDGGAAIPDLPATNGAVRLDKGGEPAASGDATTGGAAAGAAGDVATGGGDAAAPGSPRAGGGSSRLGGAIVIGVSVLLVALVLAFVLTRGDEEPEPAAEAPAPTATATPAAAAGGNDILLRGPAGSQAVGLLRLIPVADGTVRFAIAATGVAPNERGERYSLWLRSEDGSAQLLGDVQQPVDESGELTSAGPGDDDVDEFPEWFATYDTIVVTLDPENAKEPGKVILSGDLPNGG